MDGSVFAAYVEKVLVPELTSGTVVIPDNLVAHKNAVAAETMRDAGCWFLFLPPYLAGHCCARPCRLMNAQAVPAASNLLRDKQYRRRSARVFALVTQNHPHRSGAEVFWIRYSVLRLSMTQYPYF